MNISVRPVTQDEKPQATAMTNDEAQDALERVLSSTEFRGADRLKEFLSYIVHKSLEDGDAKVLGKWIAQDVYERQAQEDAATANVVRVDAGRLRRRLDAYYANSGASDPVRIHVDKGGYTPRFVRMSAQRESQSHSSQPRALGFHHVVFVAATVVLSTVIVMVWFGFTPDQQSPVTGQRKEAERTVLFESAPTSLQARNMAEEARSLMFPATQPTRLLAALALSEKAIALDPSYHGGYAGAGQAAAMFGGLAPMGDERDAMLSKARQYAEDAVRIAPATAWSQSAMAFVNMFERNFDEADRLSKRAVALDPDDLIALEIDAIIAFFSGDFERALSSAAPELHENRKGTRFPWRNVYGNASFYLEDYERSIAYLLDAAALGEPVSEINTAHLIASMQAIGRTADARMRVQEYEAAWPNSRIEEIMYQLFEDPQHAKKLIARLKEAGWRG